MLDELRAFILSSESFVYLMDLLVETSFVLGVQLDHRELVLVVLGMLVQILADAHQLGQHVELVWILMLEVLLFVEEKELDHVFAGEESVELRLFRDLYPHGVDHEALELLFIRLFYLHKDPSFLGEFAP
jgi:hypothetical protein